MVRWMCSFDTTEVQVDLFVAAVAEVLGTPLSVIPRSQDLERDPKIPRGAVRRANADWTRVAVTNGTVEQQEPICV